MNIVESVIAHLGGPSKAAKKLGFPYPSTVTNWLSKSRIPVDQAPSVETATEGAFRCEDLCPEVEWQRDKRGRITGYVVKVRAA